MPAFDQAALKAAKDQAPYNQFPPDFNQPDVWLDIPILFNPLAIEQALNMAMTSGTAHAVPPDTLSHRYAQQVQKLLAESLKYPEREKTLGITGQVILKLHVDRRGELEEATVSKSSGVSTLDNEALQAARRQAPYPPFPPELPEQDLWLDLPVLFSQ